MKIERLLQVNAAMLTVTSTLLFGMGQRDPQMPMLVILAAMFSIWFGESPLDRSLKRRLLKKR